MSRDEARAELIEIQVREGLSNGWRKRIADAIMAAGYRKPEAAPSDTDQKTIAALIMDHFREGATAGSSWRLNPTAAADSILAAGFSRSQPVQVEVTAEMIERMARMLFAQTTEARSGFNWPINGDWGRERDMKHARGVLSHVLGSAALGGGDHAE